MTYRGEERCHVCGADTRIHCPHCGNGVCRDHTLAAQIAIQGDRRDVDHAQRISKRLGGPDVCLPCVEAEIEGARGPCATVYRSGDPLQAEMILESLLEAGFDARALGTRSAALLGAGQHIFEQRIEVPQNQAEAAASMVETLLSAADPPAAGDDDRDEHEQGKRPRVVVAGMVVLGTLIALALAALLWR